MAEIKWIKIVTDIFDNRKIRQIENLPDGDAILVVWIKLLCLAGEINDAGMVYLTKEIPYTEQTLSCQFGRPLTTVQAALRIFQQFGMVEIVDNFLQISNWEKYQNVEGMEKIREQTRKRVAKHRENKRLLECNATCNATVTEDNATDKNKDKKQNRIKNIDHSNILEIFNSYCPSLPTAKTLSEARKKTIRARLNTYTLEDLTLAFKKAEESSFLTGKNNQKWVATFDWILKDTNLAKILDGNYDDWKGKEEEDDGRFEGIGIKL